MILNIFLILFLILLGHHLPKRWSFFPQGASRILQSEKLPNCNSLLMGLHLTLLPPGPYRLRCLQSSQKDLEKMQIWSYYQLTSPLLPSSVAFRIKIIILKITLSQSLPLLPHQPLCAPATLALLNWFVRVFSQT